MKIGYFVTHFPYDGKDRSGYFCGGTGVVAYNLATSMAQKGHEIVVFTTSINSKDVIERHKNVELYRYAKNFRIGVANMSLKLLYKPLKHEVDLVHTHAGNPPAPIAALRYAKKKNKPFVVTYHGDGQWNWRDLIKRMSMYFYNKYLLDRVLSYADVIISPSEDYINESRFLGKYKDKIVVIPNGMNIDEFDTGYSKEDCREKLDLPLDADVILFVGSLVPYKGPDVLVKAMQKIIKKIPDAELIFVGSGIMKEELERLSKKLGVDKRIKFAGFVNECLKVLYYRASDVFSLPSTMGPECFGIVNLEAMACGIPIVASKIGGVPDVVKDGQNGLLVPPKDSEALADAIIHLLNNEGVRDKLGKNGRERVKGYSWDKIAEETEKVYERLV